MKKRFFFLIVMIFAAGLLFVHQSPWYSDRDSVQSIIIQDGVQTVSRYAFAGCINSTTVSMPESLRQIGDYAFQDCNSLVTVVLPENTRDNLGIGLFSGCGSLVSVNLPQNSHTFPAYFFRDCTSLKAFSIPDTISTMGDAVFQRCTGLKSMVIPDSVETMGGDIFSGCTNLLSVTLPVRLAKINNGLFEDCVSLSSVNIPGTVTVIGKRCFKNCKKVTSVTIPQYVTKIDDLAFVGCERLTNVNLSVGLEIISYQAFQDCKSLQSITIPQSVDAIFNSAFYGCSALTEVVIPSGITEISGGLFQDCINLRSINIPDSVVTIGQSAFMGCEKLADVNIPDGVTTIIDNAFSGCSALKSIVIPDGLGMIYSNVFTNSPTKIYANKEAGSAITLSRNGYPFRTTGSWFDMIYSLSDNSVIAKTILYSADTNITMANIPEFIDTIGDNAFAGCSSLVGVICPDSITSIGGNAFSGCTSLEYLQSSCTSYTRIWAGQNHYPWIHKETLEMTEGVEVTCETDGFETYWSCPTCHQLYSDSIGKNEIQEPIVIAATGHDWEAPVYTWAYNYESVTATMVCAHNDMHQIAETVNALVDIVSPTETKAGMATIVSDEFDNIAFHVQTKQIDLPALNSITVVYIPDEVRIIEPEAFSGVSCRAVVISGQCLRIGDKAFASCDQLRYIWIPESVISIAPDAFDGCSSVIIDREKE